MDTEKVINSQSVMWRNLWKSRGNYVDRAVNHGVIRVRRVWKTFFAWVFQRILILSTEILRLRHTLWLPLEGKLRPQAVMRCRFRERNRFHDEKATLYLVTRYSVVASNYTPHLSAPPTPVSLRLGQARFSVSPGDRFIAAPLLRSPQGEG